MIPEQSWPQLFPNVQQQVLRVTSWDRGFEQMPFLKLGMQSIPLSTDYVSCNNSKSLKCINFSTFDHYNMILLLYPNNDFRLLSKSNFVDIHIPLHPQYWYRIHRYIAHYCFPNTRWCQDKRSHWKKACNHLGKYKWMIREYLCSVLMEE